MNVVASYKVVIDSYMGMSYTSSIPSLCAEVGTSSLTTSYNNRLPVCQFSTDSDGNIVLTVENLITSRQPTSYKLSFSGLVTGPSAKSSDANNGIYVVLYEGVTAVETIYSSTVYFQHKTKLNGVTLTGDPARNNHVGNLELSFHVD